MSKFCVWLAGSLGVISSFAFAKTVRYNLNITEQAVNLSGKQTVDFALQVNESIPAPTLEFTEGDDAEITVTNKIISGEEVSIHWHGILLPPEEDGVPYVTTAPILKGQSRTFRFKIRQHGTYWYHSHTSVQEQRGVYGAIVIHPKDKKVQADKDVVVVLSDWIDENPERVLKNLRKDGDYYLHKKNAIRSYWGAFLSGGFWHHLENEWQRMGGMDPSDVGYDAFLINGKKQTQLAVAKPGEKVRLRIINAASSSYFYVAIGQGPMRVIAADGVDIEPIVTKEILIAMAETYDVLFSVPSKNNFELRATAQDISGYTSGWIGVGEQIFAPTKVAMDPYMSMSAHAGHSSEHAGHDMAGMDMSSMEHEAASSESDDLQDVTMLSVDSLKARSKTNFSKNKAVNEVKLVLGGDMERYVWYINGKATYEDRNIIVHEGDIIRFVFQNETMMHHPMHLHGHFFRVLNQYGDYSPLKHTVDVPPHGSRTIEFLADEPGEWMLHCHNLYHMKAGMARVVKYSSFTPRPEIAEIQHMDHHLHNHPYFSGKAELATNALELELRLARTWDGVETHISQIGLTPQRYTEADLLYRYWLSNFLSVAGGIYYASEFHLNKTRMIAGVSYMLPLLIELDLFLDQRGDFRIEFSKKLQWTSSLFSDVKVTLPQGKPVVHRKGIDFEKVMDPEFIATFMDALSWELAFGFVFTEVNAGIGGQYRF